MKYQKLTSSFLLIFMMSFSIISAAPAPYDKTLSNLYESLLQREYAGPIFHDHEVERKAQRSPSLRLRFGRSDPDMMEKEKRFIGDVHQKPIRSPSLRLRFGRRSDPLMPTQDMNNLIENSNIDGSRQDATRKPNCVLCFEHGVSTFHCFGKSTEDNFENMNSANGIETSELSNEALVQILEALTSKDFDDNQLSPDEFLRKSRKTGPLRLRWGRSVADKPDEVAPVASP